jgi:hypothetical protein
VFSPRAWTQENNGLGKDSLLRPNRLSIPNIVSFERIYCNCWRYILFPITKGA